MDENNFFEIEIERRLNRLQEILFSFRLPYRRLARINNWYLNKCKTSKELGEAKRVGNHSLREMIYLWYKYVLICLVPDDDFVPKHYFFLRNKICPREYKIGPKIRCYNYW
jgi:hypothetical protein